MPLIKSAIKKLRKDKVRTVKNLAKKLELKKTLKDFRKVSTNENLSTVFSKLDRAAKRNLITKNKASRLKARMAKRLVAAA